MSFSRAAYDEGAYSHALRESLGPNDYMLSTPRIDCNGCFYPSPHVRVDRYGGAVCEKEIVDVDSELLGITRKYSRCPKQKYMPTGNEFCQKKPMRECDFLSPEDTRYSNPPCTLRSRGWNRWEWLCQNPQDKAIEPMQRFIHSKTVVKDNHRPCIPRPQESDPSLPPAPANDSGIPCVDSTYKGPRWGCSDPLPSVSWRRCTMIGQTDGKSCPSPVQ
jgi:hypothetical protein